MLRENGGKTVALRQTAGNSVHLSGNESLCDTRFDQQLSGGMHRIPHVASVFDIGYLLSTLGGTHLHHGFDQVERGGFLLLGWVDAKQVHNLNLCVEAIRREEMNV